MNNSIDPHQKRQNDGLPHGKWTEGPKAFWTNNIRWRRSIQKS